MSASALKLPGGEPSGSWNNLGVFVACEGSDRGRQVCSLLDRVGGDAPAGRRLNHSWWSFDALANAPMRQVAACEAAQADLVILAAQEGASLPEAVIEWLSLWLGMKECSPQALVALLDSDTGAKPTAQTIQAQLKGVAELGELDFFAEGPAGEQEKALTSGFSAVLRRKRNVRKINQSETNERS